MDLDRVALFIELTELDEALDSAEGWVCQMLEYHHACRYRRAVKQGLAYQLAKHPLTRNSEIAHMRRCIRKAWVCLTNITPKFREFRSQEKND